MYVSHLLPLSFCIHWTFSAYQRPLAHHRALHVLHAVVCITPFLAVARPGQLSTTHFRYFTPFFYCISHTIVHCVQIYNPVLHWYMFTFAISSIRIVLHYSCCRLYTCTPEFTALLTFTCGFLTRAFHPGVVYMPFPLPAASVPGSLHAVSVTCAFQTPMNCVSHRFHYTRTQSTHTCIHCVQKNTHFCFLV